MINDSHIHFFSPGFFAGLGATSDAITGLGWEFPESAEALADRWVTELDKHGVSRAALMASLPADAASVATAIARHPTRFVGFFMLDPTRDDAVEYATRALDDGLRTICLFPAMHHYSLHDEKVARVFELASSYEATKPPSLTSADLSAEARSAKVEGASPTSAVRREPTEPPQAARPVVFVHCGELSVGIRKKLGLPSAFDMSLGVPTHLTTHALDHPRVPIIIPHFGAGMLDEAVALAVKCPNVYLDTSSSNSWIARMPKALSLAHVFNHVLETIGASRLLFGTDSSFFPRGWNQDVYALQKASLDKIGAPEDVQQKIFGENFVRLFGDSPIRGT